MIGLKPGAAVVKRSYRKGPKHHLDTKHDPGGVAGVPDPGDGGLGVSGEWKGLADVKFIGVRDPSISVEIKHYAKHLRVYATVKEGKLVAAIIYDVFRLSVNLSYPEELLNIRYVELCIQREIQKEAQKEAQIELTPNGKTFLVEFMKRHSVKLSDDSPNAQFPLNLEGLNDEKFEVLKAKIMNLGRQCFRELKDKIIGDYAIQRRNPSLTDDRIQALKVQFAELVAELAPSNEKSMFRVLLIEYLIHLLEENQDAKSGAVRNDFVTHFKVELSKLESALYVKDGELFYNPHAPQM